MIQPDEPRVRRELAPDTGMVLRDGPTYLASLPDGPILVLDSVASLVLDCALDPDVVDTAVAVAAAYQVPVADVRTAVEACLAHLGQLGLFRTVAPSG